MVVNCVSSVYDGSINWKVWSNVSHPNIAECYGKGEFGYYCEKECAIIPESELSELSIESRESCDKKPCEISFFFNNADAIAERLLKLIEEAKKMFSNKMDVLESIVKKYQINSSIDFFGVLEEWVSNKSIDLGCIELFVESILKDMQNHIQEENKQCDVFAEIYLGLLIQECILREDVCYFTVDIC